MNPPTGGRELAIAWAGPEDYATLADLHDLCLDPQWNRQSIIGHIAAPGAPGLIARLGGRAAGFTLRREVAGESKLLAIGCCRHCGAAASGAPCSTPSSRRPRKTA